MLFQKGNTFGFTKEKPRAGPGRPKNKTKEYINFIEETMELAQHTPLTRKRIDTLIESCLKLAEQDFHYARLVFDRIIPPVNLRRIESVMKIDKSKLKTMSAIRQGMGDVIQGAAEGQIFVEDANFMLNAYESIAKTIKDVSLDDLMAMAKDHRSRLEEIKCGKS